MDMAIRKLQRTFTSRLAPFTTGDKKRLQQSASIMKGMAMKENDLTYELICAAVNGEKTALEEILRLHQCIGNGKRGGCTRENISIY